ncbi:MAG: PaaI family thioesterase [Betaproteobacteria bacterium]|nr:PaaI family thioesterase [Betaproteobacteria bacterium]
MTTTKKKPVKKAAAPAHDPHRVMQNGVARTLGMRVLSVSPKKVVAEMRVDERHMNRNGRVNGGALMAFADAMGAVGTVANLPPGHLTTTLESKTNFFAAGAEPVITGVSKPLHIGRSTNVWQTTLKNQDGRVVAVVTQTQMVLSPRADGGAAKKKK